MKRYLQQYLIREPCNDPDEGCEFLIATNAESFYLSLEDRLTFRLKPVYKWTWYLKPDRGTTDNIHIAQVYTKKDAVRLLNEQKLHEDAIELMVIGKEAANKIVKDYFWPSKSAWGASSREDVERVIKKSSEAGLLEF